MQENNIENQKTTEDGIVVRCAHLHQQGHAQTIINPPSLKDYKMTKRSYTLNDSLLDNVIISLNLLRGYDQWAPLNLKVSSRNQKYLLLKNQIEMIFSIRHNTISPALSTIQHHSLINNNLMQQSHNSLNPFAAQSPLSNFSLKNHVSPYHITYHIRLPRSKKICIIFHTPPHSQFTTNHH